MTIQKQILHSLGKRNVPQHLEFQNKVQNMDFKKLTKLEVTTSIKIINLLQIKY